MLAAHSEERATGSLDPVRDWDRRTLWTLVGVLLIRWVYAAFFPLDLAPDESYYWDWGRRPDIGYFSKPPMIGWLMGLAGVLGNHSEFGLKVFPAFLATLGLGFLYLLGRDTYGGRVGYWTVLLVLATPANWALASFFTIDAPLFLFWSASLWVAWRWWSSTAHRTRWALTLVLPLGLGYLTKQIQLVFPVLLALFMGLGRRGPLRRGDGARWVLVAALSLLFLLPPLIWNWRHDWITFRHTADELATAPFRWARSLKFLGEFVGGQAGLGGGMTWVLMVVAVVAAVRRWRETDERGRFLVLFGAPGWVAFVALAFHQRVEQNWPLVFYSAPAVLASAWLAGATARLPTAEARRGGWRYSAIGMGAVLALLLLAVPFVCPRLPFAGSKSDPTARVRGWRELARQVEPLRARLPQPERTFLLAPDDRYVASALAFYLPDHPRTYGWEDPAHPESQYGIWGRPSDRVGWDALMIVRNPQSPSFREVEAGCFERVEPWGEVTVKLGPGQGGERKYRAFLGRKLRSVSVPVTNPGGG